MTIREHPILFSRQMIQAIRTDRKTQTRRVIGVDPEEYPRVGSWHEDAGQSSVIFHSDDGGESRSQWTFRLSPGDRLWVREEWSPEHRYTGIKPKAIAPWGSRIWYWADGNPTHGDRTKPKPSIHMPMWVSRITLAVTDMKVERLQSITAADCLAEGVSPEDEADPIGAYRSIWNGINGASAWDKNPWVVAITFTVLRQGHVLVWDGGMSAPLSHEMACRLAACLNQPSHPNAYRVEPAPAPADRATP